MWRTIIQLSVCYSSLLPQYYNETAQCRLKMSGCFSRNFLRSCFFRKVVKQLTLNNLVFYVCFLCKNIMLLLLSHRSNDFTWSRFLPKLVIVTFNFCYILCIWLCIHLLYYKGTNPNRGLLVSPVNLVCSFPFPLFFLSRINDIPAFSFFGEMLSENKNCKTFGFGVFFWFFF